MGHLVVALRVMAFLQGVKDMFANMLFMGVPPEVNGLDARQGAGDAPGGARG
jgi:hypothetical protein